MRIKMKALDTIFFRDGKPFSMGEENWSDGIFPPYPSVFYGALRGGYFSENIELFRSLRPKDFNTSLDPSAKLKITEISLMMDDRIVFPFPADCLLEKGSDDLEAHKISRFQAKGLSSSPCDYILKTDNKNYEEVKEGYITQIEFESYLNNKGNRFCVNYLYNESVMRIFNEPKIGIARNPVTRIAEDSMLYRVDMKRLDKLDMVIDFSGLELERSGLLKLGGEGKAVSYKVIEANQIIKLPEIEKEFIMYLATPAIFNNGWLPGFIDPESLTGEIVMGLKVKLRSAIVNRPLLIGGFDIQLKKPKTMMQAVPSGSLYYFEILEGAANLLESIQGKSVSDFKTEEGFGIAYFGKSNMEIDI
ncbi:MAG: type III-B CRISPR module-associated protein Cmr3 [Candidatus Cloacimonetes bacterium]|nr:type III-B CRISPR module-associated protein Cmr3 [Candidatus Cloacimonadota bacterium]